MMWPFTRIWFVTQDEVDVLLRDNSREIKRNKKPFAEYNILTRELVWREWDNQQAVTNEQRILKIKELMPLSSPFVIVPFLRLLERSSNVLRTPQQRLGDGWLIIPIVLGIWMFLAFDFYGMKKRERGKIVDTPQPDVIREYFSSTSHKYSARYSFLKNEFRRVKLTWFRTTGITVLGLALAVFQFWHYSWPATFWMFIVDLMVVSILIAFVLVLMWYVPMRYVIKKQVLRKLDEQTEKMSYTKDKK